MRKQSERRIQGSSYYATVLQILCMDTKWEFHFQAFITHTVLVLQIFHCCYWNMERELCLEDLDSPDREQCYSVCFDV